jgi:hypothetical protein
MYQLHIKPQLLNRALAWHGMGSLKIFCAPVSVILVVFMVLQRGMV